MSFLRLNQLIIPIQSGGPAERSYDDKGRASRGVTGLMSMDRIYNRRRWEFKTKPMPRDDLTGLQDWLTGAVAWGFPLDGNSNSNIPASMGSASNTGLVFPSATAADGLTVTTAAKYGSGSMTFPISTTNVWPSNVITGTDASSNTSGFTAIASGAISSDTAHFWQGSRALNLVASGAGDGVKTNTFAGSGGGWSATFYVTGSGVQLTCKLMSGTTVYTTVTIVPTGSWTRVMIEQGKGNSIPAGDVHIEVTAAGAGTWWLDGFQLENRVYATTWCNNTQSGGTVWGFTPTNNVPIWASGRGATFSCWMTKASIFGGCWMMYLFGGGGSLIFGITTQDTWDTLGAYISPDGGTTVYRAQPGLTSWPTEWRHVVAVWDRYAWDGFPLKFYLDGVLVAKNGSAPSSMDLSTRVTLDLCTNNGSTACNANVDDAVVLPYPMGPAFASSIYQAGAAFPTTWPYMTADGDAMAEGAISVVGVVDNIEYMAVGDGSGFRDNMGQATVKLWEAQ